MNPAELVAQADETIGRHTANLAPEDNETALAYLLGDLLHWADYNEVDFSAALSRARDYFQMETT